MLGLICVLGLIVLNHSCLMLVNIRGIQGTRLIKYVSIITFISDVLGIIALFVKGLGNLDNIVVDVLLKIPFVVGIVVFIIRKINQKKYKEVRVSKKSKSKKKNK